MSPRSGLAAARDNSVSSAAPAIGRVPVIIAPKRVLTFARVNYNHFRLEAKRSCDEPGFLTSTHWSPAQEAAILCAN
jgi:hypothetical protein